MAFSKQSVIDAVSNRDAFMDIFVVDVSDRDMVVCKPCVAAFPKVEIHSHFEKVHGGGKCTGEVCFSCVKPLAGDAASKSQHYSGQSHSKIFARWRNQSVCTVCGGGFARGQTHAKGRHDAHCIHGFDCDEELYETAARAFDLKDDRTYHKLNDKSSRMGIQGGGVVNNFASQSVRCFAICMGATTVRKSVPVCISHICQMTGWDSRSPTECSMWKATQGSTCRVCQTIGITVDTRLLRLQPEHYNELGNHVEAGGVVINGKNGAEAGTGDAPPADQDAGQNGPTPPQTPPGQTSPGTAGPYTFLNADQAVGPDDIQAQQDGAGGATGGEDIGVGARVKTPQLKPFTKTTVVGNGRTTVSVTGNQASLAACELRVARQARMAKYGGGEAARPDEF